MKVLSIVPALAGILSFTTSTLAQTANGAIVPFSTLPTCATLCGPLYDAQGACTPPVTSSVDKSCFCKYGTLQGFYTQSTGVCGATACANSPNDLVSIQTWFKSYCGSSTGSQGTTTSAATTATAAATGTDTAAATSATASATTTPGIDDGAYSTISKVDPNLPWIQTHYQYIVMLAVIIVGLAAFWFGLAMFRRNNRRKRELQYEMRPPGAPWVAGQKGQSPYGYGDNVVDARDVRTQKNVGKSPYGGNGGSLVDPPTKTKSRWGS